MKTKRNERINATKYNKYNELMTLIEYIDARNIYVQFYDDNKTIVHTNWKSFDDGTVYNPYKRIGDININYQNQIMKIVEYNSTDDIVIEFQNEFKYRTHTTFNHFKNGQVKDFYQPSILNIGICGQKYKISDKNNKPTKEYKLWKHMLERSYDEKLKEKYDTYKDVTCCDEWLMFENFYEWLHSQLNFDKWYNNDGWHLDKDILVKRNKIYSPETCVLIPQNINTLFTKCDKFRGNLPIGVSEYNGRYKVMCNNPFIKKQEYLGYYSTPEKAFQAYKVYKEDIIRKIAEIEYQSGNITKQCYEAMMNYKVEITD